MPNPEMPPEDPRELASRWGLPYREDLAALAPWEAFVRTFDIAMARRHRMLGLLEEGCPVLAICDRAGWRQADIVRRLLGTEVTLLLSSESGLLRAINAAYEAQTGQTQELIDALDRDAVLSEVQSLADREDLLDSAGRAPVIRLVNMILFEAVKNGASDVHIQPYEDRVIVRQRIDGVLFDAFEIPKELQGEVTTRIKVLGRMDIA